MKKNIINRNIFFIVKNIIKIAPNFFSITQDLNVLSIAEFDWSVEEQQINNSLMDGLSKKTRIKCTNMPAEKDAVL